MTNAVVSSRLRALLDDGSDMGARILAHDWAATPLGPLQSWPSALVSAVTLMVRTRQPVYIAWGPDRLSLYNDACFPIVGTRHPQALGMPASQLWQEVWDNVGPLFEAVLAGEPQWHEDRAIALDVANGDTRWFSFSCTPLLDDDAAISGLYWVAQENTSRVLDELHLKSENERQWRMFEQAPGFICTTRGPDHVFEYVNAAHRRLFASDQWLGKPVREAIPGIAEQGFLQLVDQVYASGERMVVREAPVHCKASPEAPAQTRYLDFIYAPRIESDGRVSGLFCEGHDVTDRVQALQALSVSDQRYRQIVEGAEDFAIITLDQHAVITGWNTGAQRMMGYSEEEAIGQPGAIFFTPEDIASGAVDAEIELAKREGRAVNERWHLRKDGTRFWGSGLMMQVHAPGDRLLKMFRDRTQGHATEARLKRGSEQLQELAVAALDAARAETLEDTLNVVTHAARSIIGAHQGVVSLTQGKDWGHSINTVSMTDKYQQWKDFAARPDGSGIYAWLCEENRPVRMTQAELEAHPRWRAFGVHASGHPPLRGWLAAPMVSRDGRNLGLIQLSDKQDGDEFDASDEAMLVQLAQVASAAVEQSLTDTALRRSEEQLRLATDNAEVGLWDLDLITGTLFWQPRVKQMFGIGADVSVSMQDFYDGLHPADRDCTAAAFAAAMDPERRAVYDTEYRTVGQDGVQRWVAAKGRGVFDYTGRCVRVLGTAMDITARRRIEEKVRELNDTLEHRVEEQSAERMKAEDSLRQAHKMEAVGQLTGGIAHDFNNMLGAVVGSFDLILRNPADLERVQRYAEGGLHAAERGARLTGQLLTFSRAQQIEMKPLMVARLVSDMRDMLAQALGPMVRLILRLGGGDTRVMADPTQLEMAVLNLVINARDAMPEGGELTVTTAVRHLEQDTELRRGDYVEICVGDTGAGMDEDVAARAFEPFFTTKGVGKGTGLGLSQVYGIACQAGGAVRIDTRPSAGTRVSIYLPVTSVQVSAETQLPELETVHTQAAVTILVVDDDTNLRGVLVETLDALGYRVLEAEDGPSGLAALEANTPDLLMLDFAMPGMNGAEVARIALQRHPALPIVFSTGYADIAAITEVAGSSALVLRKPFRVAELQAMLAVALEGRNGASA